MEHVKSFKESEVYKLYRKIANEIYNETKRFQKEDEKHI